MNTERLSTWNATYGEMLNKAIREHPEKYSYGPEDVAPVVAKMQHAFSDGTFNHDGYAIKLTCKAVGIKHTRKAILAFLNGETI